MGIAAVSLAVVPLFPRNKLKSDSHLRENTGGGAQQTGRRLYGAMRLYLRLEKEGESGSHVGRTRRIIQTVYNLYTGVGE
jgi:hypothetical protein